jgi:hypothetical protein
MALGKEIKKKQNFRYRVQTFGTRQRVTVGDCYHLRLLCRASGFAERPTLGKEPFAEGFSLPSAALDKERLCRVPDIWHSAKHFALGKVALSGSGRYAGTTSAVLFSERTTFFSHNISI